MTELPLEGLFISMHPAGDFLYKISRNPQSLLRVLTMMLGHNPTVQIPPWSDDPTAAGDYSPAYLREAISALHRYLPARDLDAPENDQDFDLAAARDGDAPVDAYSCDHFRMFEFKIRRCPRGRSHDWTECPYAHPGEKARRRDPRRHHYSGTACAEFRKGSCRRGESCEFAHGVFECWLHPARYRTQVCKDGPGCPRRVCFFAHAPGELRVLPTTNTNTTNSLSHSPRSTDGDSYSESPPVSPVHQMNRCGSGSGPGSISEMVASLRNLNLQMGKCNKVQPLPSPWAGSPVFGSPVFGSPLRPGFLSLPTTPTQVSGARIGASPRDFWDAVEEEEEPAMERVESGRDLRVRMFEKLSKDNPLDRPDPVQSAGVPDLGWVSELVK